MIVGAEEVAVGGILILTATVMTIVIPMPMEMMTDTTLGRLQGLLAGKSQGMLGSLLVMKEEEDKKLRKICQEEGIGTEIFLETWDLDGLSSFSSSLASFATSWRFSATLSSTPSNRRQTGISCGSNTSVRVMQRSQVSSAMHSGYA